MFHGIVLSTRQQANTEQEGLPMNLIHPPLSLEFAITLRALYHAVFIIVVLEDRISTRPLGRETSKTIRPDPWTSHS